MKKTIHINVSGQLFHVDEDAFEKLSAYLKSLELSLQQQDGGQEIYSDLEARVSELFHEKLSTKSQIVSRICCWRNDVVGFIIFLKIDGLNVETNNWNRGYSLC